MQSKGMNPASMLHGVAVSPLIEAYFEMNRLKQLYRQGWLQCGIVPERCESVAEHSFGEVARSVKKLDFLYIIRSS